MENGTNENPSSQSSPTNITPPSPTEKIAKILGIALLSFCALFSILLVIYVGLISHESKANQKSVQTVAGTTQDWKTYTNDQYGFEFKYPSEERVETENSLSSVFIYVTQPKEAPGFSVEIATTTMTNLIDWYNYEFKNRQKELLPSKKIGKMYGDDALFINDPISEGWCNGYFIIIRNKNTYNFPSSNCFGEPVISISSTFKFTEPKADTTGWKTYTNSEYGFELKYPDYLLISENSFGAFLNVYKNNKVYECSKDSEGMPQSGCEDMYEPKMFLQVFVSDAKSKFLEAYKDTVQYQYDPNSLMSTNNLLIDNQPDLEVSLCLFGEKNHPDCLDSIKSKEKTEIIIQNIIRRKNKTIVFSKAGGEDWSEYNNIMQTIKFTK